MTIRARLSLWYSTVMFVAMMAVGIFLYHELIVEPRRAVRPQGEPHLGSIATESEGVFEDVGDVILWCCLPALVLAVAGGWWLMQKSLEPVASLAQIASNITARNLKARLPRTHNGDEIDQLAEVFNAMLERLDASFLQIHEFTLHASHELKTPLTVLCNQAEAKLFDKSTPSPDLEYYAEQLDELRRLSRIVDGLTLLAKADAGMAPLDVECVSLNELVSDAFDDAKLLAGSKGLSVNLTECEGAMVQGDPHRLRQLLLNLVDNAVKYNRTGGWVMMALRRGSAYAEIVITNSGPGIPAEILPRVFDRFFRGDPSHSHTIDGCGLGLSIARWIVSAHRGSINIASDPATHTSVTVQLPILNAAMDDGRGKDQATDRF